MRSRAAALLLTWLLTVLGAACSGGGDPESEGTENLGGSDAIGTSETEGAGSGSAIQETPS